MEDYSRMMLRVFDDWKRAGVQYISPKEAFSYFLSPDFYPHDNYAFPDQPTPTDGLLGYDDLTKKLIAVRAVN